MIINKLDNDAEIKDVLFKDILENVPGDLGGLLITGIEDVYLDNHVSESNEITGTCLIEVEKEEEDYSFNASFTIEIDEFTNEILQVSFDIDFD